MAAPNPNIIELRITATGAEQAAKILQGVADAGGRVGSAVAKGAAEAKRELSGLGDSAKRVLEVFTGLQLSRIFEQALVAMKDFAAGAVKLALEAEAQTASFNALTASIGVNGEALAANLEKAAEGLLDVEDAMQAASKVLIEGLQPKQIVEMMQVARQLSKLFGGDVLAAFTAFSDAVASGNTRTLRQIGIFIDAGDAAKKYAEANGMAADELNGAQKAQATFTEAMTKAKPVAEAMSKATLDWNETIKRARVSFEEFGQKVGEVLLTAGFAILEWLQKISGQVPTMSRDLAQFGELWKKTWTQAKESLAPVVTILEITLIPLLKIAVGAVASFALGLAAAFTLVAGPAAYFASILGDIAQGKLPNLKRAHAEQELAAAEARVRLAETGEAWTRLAFGTATATAETKKNTASMGENKAGLAALGQQAKATAGDIDKISDAIRDLTGQLAKQTAGEIQNIEEAFMRKLAGTKNLSAEDLQRYREFARSLAALVVEQKRVNAEQEDFIKLMSQAEHAQAAADAAYEESQTLRKIEVQAAGAAAMLGAASQAVDDFSGQIEASKQPAEEANAAWNDYFTSQEKVRLGSEALGQTLADILPQNISITERAISALVDAMIKADTAGDISLFERLAKDLEVLRTRLAQLKGDAAIAEVRGQFDLLNVTLGENRDVVAKNQAAWALAKTTYDKLPPSAKAVADSIANLNLQMKDRQAAQQYVDDLEAIRDQAELLGPGFDTIGAALARVKTRMLEVAAAVRQGATEMKPELQDLKVEFDRLTDLKKTQDAIESVFSSIMSALDTLVKGVIQGTQTIGDAFKKLGQAIVLEFANQVISGALKPLAQAAGALITSLFSGSSNAAVAGARTTTGIPLDFSGGEPSSVTGLTGTASNSGLLTTLGSGISAFTKGAALFQHGSTVWNAVVTGWDAGFGGLTGAAQGFMNGLDAVGKTVGVFGNVVAAATAAVSIALIAMRDDITDTGKAIISSFYAASAATAIGTGWTGVGIIVAAILAAIGAILDWTGIFEKASEDWLKFPSKLAGTLGKEQEALKGFGDAMAKTSTLEGIAKNIEDFRHAIEEQAGVGGFFERTKGMGVFTVPGIPGATGTKHEGGLLFDFGPYIIEMQQAINKTIDFVKDTISVKLREVAIDSLGESLGAAFAAGHLGKLRQEFDALVTSTTATVEDVKAFEERMKAIGELITRFAQIAEPLDQLAGAAEDFLPPEIAALVADGVGEIRRQLVDLAASGAATEEQLAAVEAQVAGLGAAAQLYQKLNTEIALLSGNFEEVTQAAKDAAAGQLRAADRAVNVALDRLAEGLTGAELAAAFVQVEQALMERYELERRLIAEIQQNIVNLLSTFGPGLMRTATSAISFGASSEMFTNLITSLQEVERSSGSAAKQIWAANAALAAIAAAIPEAFATLASQITPANLGQATQIIYEAALPSLTTLGNLFGQALEAGDIQGALGILEQGADHITALANAAIAGIQQWEAAQVAAAQASATAQIKAINEAADAAIEEANAVYDAHVDQINEAADAQIEANDAQIEALQAQKETMQDVVNLSREWRRVIESIDKFISDLMTGGATPLNPADAFAYAQQQYRAALATFGADQTPQNAAAVQSAAQTMLQAFQTLSPAGRPSPEYEALVNQTVAELRGVQSAAAAFITPEEEAAASLASIDEQIAALNETNDAIREAADAQLEAIKKGLDEWIDSINESRDSQILAVERARDANIAAIHEAAAAQIQGIRQGVADIMGQIAAKQAELLGKLIEQQEQVLNSITGGLTPAQYTAKATGATVAELINLRTGLASALAGEGPGNLIASPTMERLAMAEGGIVRRPTFALIGEAGPEAVVPLDRYQGSGPASIDIGTVSITVNGTSDARRAGQEAADAFVKRLRVLVREDPGLRHELERVMRDRR